MLFDSDLLTHVLIYARYLARILSLVGEF